MENLVVLLGTLEWLPMDLFSRIPFAVTVITVLLCFVLLHKHWKDRYNGRMRAAFGSLSLGSLFGVLTSVVLGLYVLLQPLRALDGNRWLAGANRMDLAQLDAIDSIDNRIVGPTLNPVIDNINQQITTVNDVSQLGEQSANTVYGFVHTIGQSQQYLTYLIVGSALLLLCMVLLGVTSLGERRYDQKQSKNLLQRVAALEAALEAETGQPGDPNRRAWQSHPEARAYAYVEDVDYANSAQVRDYLSLKRLRADAS